MDSVLSAMLNRLVDSTAGGSMIPTSDRRALAGQCVDAVSIYPTDFCTAHAEGSSPSSEPSRENLIYFFF